MCRTAAALQPRPIASSDSWGEAEQYGGLDGLSRPRRPLDPLPGHSPVLRRRARARSRARPKGVDVVSIHMSAKYASRCPSHEGRSKGGKRAFGLEAIGCTAKLRPHLQLHLLPRAYKPHLLSSRSVCMYVCVCVNWL